ncbi:T32E20.21 [Arabidopsis thaliana]|uniref:T32E20.21 n=1 Tax=Arabidopsis thaliana TaxID=3702 RepID=Q9LP99_ARATH|nr:T32E20.21 [Arabidopsis thaliana]
MEIIFSDNNNGVNIIRIWRFLFAVGTLDAFGVQTEEKQNMKSKCPMTPSAKVLYRSLGALPGQITLSQPRRSKQLNFTQSRSRRNHPIRTTRSHPHDIHSIALDHKVAGPFNLDFTAFHSIARRSP